MRAIVEQVLASPLVASVALLDERLLIYNDVAARLYGDRHPGALGRPLAAAFPDTYPSVAALYDRAFAGEAVQVAGQPLAVGTAGPGQIFDAALTPVRNTAGAVIGALMLGVEIGGRLRADAALRESEARFHAFVTASADVIYRMSPDWGEMRQLEGKSFLRDTGEPEADWLSRYIHPDDQATVRTAIDRAIRTRSVFELEHRVLRADGSLGFTRSRAVPILDDRGEIREWLGAASDVTAARTLEDARMQADLQSRQSEARYLSLFNAIDQGFATIEVAFDAQDRPIDYRFLEVSPSFEQQTGVADPTGRWISEVLPDQDRRWLDTFARVALTGEPARFEDFSAPLPRWWEVFAYRIDDPARRRIGVLFRDISRRKGVEVALRHSEEHHAFLLKLSDTLRPLRDAFDVQAATMRLVADHLDVVRASYFAIEPDQDRFTLVASHERGVPPLPEPLRISDFAPDMAQNYRSGLTLIIEDSEVEAPTEPERAAYRAIGVRAGVGVPLVKDGQLLGIFGVHSATPRKWTPAQIQLLEDVADRIWAALERARAEAALHEAEQRQAFLLELSDALRLLAEPLAVQIEATRVLCQHLAVDRVQYHELDPDNEWIRPGGGYANDVPLHPGPSRMDDFGPFVRDAYEGGRTLVVADTESDARVTASERAEFAGIGVRAFIAVPLVKNGRFVGVLGLDHATPRSWSPAEIALAEDVAERTWAAVERARAEQALRHSEARLAAAFESVPIGAAVIDLTGRALISNAEYRRFLPSGVIPSRDAAGGARWRGWDKAGRMLAPHDFPGARALRGERVVPGQEMLYTDDAGEEIWTSVATVPTCDERGEVTGAVTAISDISIAKRHGEALRESELRLQQFGEASQDVLWSRDAETLQWEYLTPAFETIYGLEREAALRGDNMTGWLDLIVPEDRAHAEQSLQRVRAGHWVTFEFRIRRPIDGDIRWMRNTDFPIQDASGKVVRIGGIGHDITELKRAEAIVAENEDRLRTLMEGIPQLVWRSSDMGMWTWASGQWLDFTGQRQEETHALGWLDAVHPDERATTMLAWGEARSQGMLDVEYRVRRAADGAWLWHHTRSVPVRDAQGGILEWLGTSTDIQKLREMQERQHVLVTELQHRTFNLISVVRSMADATLRSSDSLDDFKLKFRDRVGALARVQRLLSRLREGDRITLDELIRTELRAAGAFQQDDGRVTLEGPEGITLRSSTVQTFAMAIHELTTNAVKYGALKQPDAHLDVRWRVEADENDRPWLHVEWTETGVSIAQAGAKPVGTGQGRTLIEQALPYQLRARTTYIIADDGVRCSIALPVSHQTEAGRVNVDA